VLIVVFLAFAGPLCSCTRSWAGLLPNRRCGTASIARPDPPGTRIEETEIYFQRVEDYIRQVIPAERASVIVDNIGVPNAINLALSDSVTVGASDARFWWRSTPSIAPPPAI
jgi:hypothetical protein